MILHGDTKKDLEDVVNYFVKSTGLEYDDFLKLILSIKKGDKLSETYNSWLGWECLKLLKRRGVSIDDCIENKDIMRSAVAADKSRSDGEFYTPEIWCAEGRKYLQNMLKDKWGKVNVWDASCGTGNLMKTANYPPDKLFLSSLMAEDIEVVKALYPGATCFQLDFLNNIDYDENNMWFSDKLPENLRKKLEANEPICFYMNPPYKVSKANITDIGSAMNMVDMGKCGLDLFHQFLYRIILLKRFYHLTDVSLGLFGPITFIHSQMIAPLYEEFCKEFKFNGGMFFNAGDFSGTSESVGWAIGYTVWGTREATDATPNKVLLDIKAVDMNGKLRDKGRRMISNVEENLHVWVNPKDVLRYTMMPAVTSMLKPTGYTKMIATNALGQLMTSNYAIRGTRRCTVTTLPCVDGVDITEENFWRCVASFAARRCYASKTDVFANCQYLSKPDVEADGYNQWLKDALVLFLFDYSNNTAAYRNYRCGSEDVTLGNKLFPIDRTILQTCVTDENIVADINAHPVDNKFLLRQLEICKSDFSEKAWNLYEFCMQKLVESLSGVLRKEAGYKNGMIAWDASLMQVRTVKDLWSPETESKFAELLAELKAYLYDKVFEYGFLMDNGESVDSANNYNADDLNENMDNEVI